MKCVYKEENNRLFITSKSNREQVIKMTSVKLLKSVAVVTALMSCFSVVESQDKSLSATNLGCEYLYLFILLSTFIYLLHFFDLLIVLSNFIYP